MAVGEEAAAWGIAAAAAPAVSDETPAVAKARAHPWLRYWARSFDVLALLVILTFAGIVRPDSVIQNLLALYLFVPIEAALLSVAGTTPGKWLFRITVEDSAGRHPAPATAVRRTFGVLVYGLGLLIPLISLIAQVVAYMRLMDKGATTWDERAGTRVRHREITPVRGIAILAVFFALVAVLAVSSYLARPGAGGGAET
ncbi:MAG TPA: RDD family protein [Bryobacteraceae bacterium]|nr:RDD family protein [Bryobacteraceae bacterium]